MALLDTIRPALPAVFLLTTWANLRGKVAGGVHGMLGIATIVTLSTLPDPLLLMGSWLGSIVVTLAIFRHDPTLGLRLAAAVWTVLVVAQVALST